MSEFEKELKKNMKLRKIAYERESIDSDSFVSKWDIERIFKDWQPPKPLVVVPQFVSDWFDINQDDIDGNIKALTRNIDRKLKIEWSEMDRWFMYSPNKPIETLISMKLDGYTVEKPQLFYLKNKNTGHILYRQPKEAGGKLIEVVATINEEYTWFTQDEIDTMHIGSYEKIEVDQ